MEQQYNTSLGNSTAAADLARVQQILGWVTFALGLPSILLSIYMLSQLIRSGNGTPAQAINLLISDIFNLITRPHTTSTSVTVSADGSSVTSLSLALTTDIPSLVFYFGVASNVVFMVGMAQERHLRVASQRCHGCCRRAKQSAAISLAIWAAPVGMVLLLYFGYRATFLLCLLLPFPLLLIFLLDGFRAVLCCSSSYSSSSSSSVAPSRAERRRVLAMLAAIFVNYTVLLLPFALTTLLAVLEVPVAGIVYFGLAANMLLYLSPVVNPFLSLLLTRSLRELLDTFPCCRRREGSFDATMETTSTTATASAAAADSPVVFENFGVTLPFSNTGNWGSGNSGNSLIPGSPSMFSSQGMDTIPNGISTIFGSLPNPGGVSSMCPQVPPVSGGLAAIPIPTRDAAVATHGQVATLFGEPVALVNIPKDNGVTLPSPNIGDCGNDTLLSGGHTMFSAPGMVTVTSNGLSIIFGNFNPSSPGGMLSVFPQVLPVAGALAAQPSGDVQAHGQAAMVFGNPMTLTTITKDPDTTSTETEAEVNTRL